MAQTGLENPGPRISETEHAAGTGTALGGTTYVKRQKSAEKRVLQKSLL